MKLLRNRNSYLIKIVRYFFVVLMIPLATIIVLNIQSQNIIRKQILLSNQNTLEQVFHLMDAMVTEMRDTCLDVAMRKELSKYVRSIKNDAKGIAYDRYELYQLLSAYTLEKYEDLYVYFPEDGYIISGAHGMVSAENYCKVYYDKTQEMAQDFRDNLNTPYGYPVLEVLDPWGQDAKLCVTMRCMLDYKLGYCIITVVMDFDELKSLVNEDNAGRGGTILLFDNQKELLLVGNKEKLPFNMIAYQGNDNPYEAEFAGEQYVMQVYPLQVLKGYCAYAIPADYFWDKISSMRLFSMISIAVCILMGSLSVWMVSKKTYAPLGDIVQKLSGGNKETQKWQGDITEFEYLEELFCSQEEEKQKLHKRVRESRGDLKERFILRLLNGEVYDVEHNDDVFRQNGITLCSDRFAVGIISWEKGYDNADGIITYVIVNVFEEVMTKIGKGYVVSWQEGKHVFLLNTERNIENEQILAVLEDAKQFMEYHAKLHITISCSAIHEGMREIQKSYQEAVETLAYQYVLGKRRIIFWEQICDRTFSYLNSSQAMLPAVLEDYLNQTRETIAVSKFVTELFQQYGIDEYAALETVECFKFDVVNAVNRAGLRSGVSEEERRRYMRQLLEQETLAGLEECLANLLLVFRQKNLEQKCISICDRAKAYMEENYHDSQLSVTTLCESLGVSSSYLLRLYRENYDTSISHEITRVRLKKAKELLADTDLNINEIAEQTGFSNGNVFIKVFKKWEGITPGRYREL